jgi:ATP synthase protein I
MALPGLLTRGHAAHSTVATIRGKTCVPDPEHKRRLEQLNKRIEAVKKTQEPTPRADEHYSQAHLAWRMVIEMVAGLAIGFGIGYGLDSLFGTLPIFLVLFTLLGMAAGVKTMLRSAQEIQEQKLAEQAERDERD